MLINFDGNNKPYYVFQNEIFSVCYNFLKMVVLVGELEMSLKRALEKCLKREPVRNVKIGGDLPEHLKTGLEGENFAAEHLLASGYRIVGRNVRYRFGEIDIIARDGNDIVFVEVKTRAENSIMPAEEAVSPLKLEKLTKAAHKWVEENNYDGFWRVDLVAVTVGRDGRKSFEHIKDITEGIF